jgi:hypothetical protein
MNFLAMVLELKGHGNAERRIRDFEALNPLSAYLDVQPSDTIRRSTAISHKAIMTHSWHHLSPGDQVLGTSVAYLNYRAAIDFSFHLVSN